MNRVTSALERVRARTRGRAVGDRGTAADVAGDGGLSTVEMVVLAPVMVLFVLVLVGFGQLVEGRGAVDGAARDAARAGSIQKDRGLAMTEARKAAEADLSDVCAGPVTVAKTSEGFEPGGFFTVEVSCEVRGLGMLGLNIPTTLTGRSASPLDPFRRAA
ncbi:TadE/TadG family type IV pilus assembly protein [Streptomyces sp. NPDC097595]|uniref:TadE/TadG family type IV pilus assembly protein n=1 Tax=Streptomyces sp. NPDC097595 TaxID=3366090 RepID=UPI003825F78B